MANNQALFLSASRQIAGVTESIYQELGRKRSKVSRDTELAAAVKRELRDVLAKLRRSWVRYHHEGALIDAVELCAMSGFKKPRWLSEALVERGLESVRGIKRKRKTGPHTDFLRNHYLFTMVQGRRDADARHHLGTALLGAHDELKSRGQFISLPRLEGIYKSHRKLVTRRNGEWVRRAKVYFPRRSGAFYSLPSAF